MIFICDLKIDLVMVETHYLTNLALVGSQLLLVATASSLIKPENWH